MTADNRATIDARVSLYLERCKLPRPSSIAIFLNAMKDEHGWTDADLIQLQGRVIGVLADRIIPAPRER